MAEITPGPTEFANAEVYLPKGDRNEIAKVLGRKRNLEGLYIGRKHANPKLDSRIFTVEFQDGEQQDIAYNILAEHMYSQIDTEGKQHRLFVAIINHRKNNRAIDKADQFRSVQRKRVKKKTTAGWQFEVEWKDGTTSWLPLKALMESNSVEIANFPFANKIDTEPAFDWWSKELLHKQRRFIKLSQKRSIQTGFEFGLPLPLTVRGGRSIRN